ncbi:hypothetical protein MNB_ARC-1_402 [hydrothermal vent metagenome]|uniref:Helix-turn-helix domain-containing protein n=1 Tax=hydrothermal vent metagenome TaxID=652676 RepID=A0A3B1E534_9ZZZZ
MEKLVTSTEAAKILGISLQGVHYRIKQGKLKYKKTDGKVFVYIDESIKHQTDTKNDNDVITVKNEQILFLTKSLKWVKKQYKSEICRLEENQNKIIKVFQSEINLLQSAFNEMKTIYNIENKKKTNMSNNEEKDLNSKPDNKSFETINIKDFFIFMKRSNKSDSEIKSIILKCIKRGDNRFIFNRQTKEVIIYNDNFIDLIN